MEGTTPKICIGDFNCKSPLWNSRAENRNGKKLKDFAEKQNAIVIGPELPTYLAFGRGIPDVIDIAILKKTTKNYWDKQSIWS